MNDFNSVFSLDHPAMNVCGVCAKKKKKCCKKYKKSGKHCGSCPKK